MQLQVASLCFNDKKSMQQPAICLPHVIRPHFKLGLAKRGASARAGRPDNVWQPYAQAVRLSYFFYKTAIFPKIVLLFRVLSYFFEIFAN